MNTMSRHPLGRVEARFSFAETVATVVAVGILLWMALTLQAAPPSDLANSDSVVGRVHEVDDRGVVVETDVERDGVNVRDRVRMAVMDSTEVRIADEPAKLRDLRPGDPVRVVPAKGAPGVAARITAARTGGGDAVETEAVERRAERADERLAKSKRSEARSERTGRQLTSGRVFVMELPASSAAARAGFRPGDVVVFANVGSRDARVLDGLNVRTTGREATFVIGRSPRQFDADADVDVEVEKDVDDSRPRPANRYQRRDVDVEIDRDR